MSDSRQHIPEGFHSVTPYLVVSATAHLMDFLKQPFDAQETFRMARPDGTIGHASMRIGGSMVEMADPANASGAMPSALHLYVPNSDQVFRLAVQAGAT